MNQLRRWARMSALKSNEPFDVAIVGGGPAGLAAAVYLGRFRRSVVVFDADDGRAKLIVKSHNCPGFPDGIGGEDLLRRLTAQAAMYGAVLRRERVVAINPVEAGFVVYAANEAYPTRQVILATGVTDITPDVPHIREGIAKGTIRLCPVCDGYEVIDKAVAVMGPEESAMREALFLKQYTPNVTVLASRPEGLSANARRRAAAFKAGILDNANSLLPMDSGYEVLLENGRKQLFEVIYIAMGCVVRSELATYLGADCSEDGYVRVDAHQRTSAEGVSAIGDVVKALNQIAVGFGHAAVAASDIHNQLLRQDPR
ncbi:NAD(P)/FAD-dependent oxidoreductase [Mesorhizobium sp. BR1-1-9]|uniref:NAD(P)/FAD-dependent oxidoreductase n=1 Tax=unclassified Mesorhizobium TaxID=325217 RepID=UPI001CD1332D|nr:MULTISPECIES: NAD(P)/FAD-dependent oxidoreductase [unclassified Mesorhizobium]MBZ9874686.1 NAD(P)/FAD-dependent oxidoreductase [Mesorhizobium sp. BR1-1-9]MBZ9942148.1 NAD(P)/FAD-dependent oxidoreductase [Mesorhizobium sp. BR1-1-13]